MFVIPGARCRSRRSVFRSAPRCWHLALIALRPRAAAHHGLAEQCRAAEPASLRPQPDVRPGERLRAAGEVPGRRHGRALARHRLDGLAGRATYDFTLRPGVTFSDGTPFDAPAVKANFDAISPTGPVTLADLARQIDRTEVTGPLAVRLVLKAPHAPTLNELSLPRPFRFVSPAAMRRAAPRRAGSRPPSARAPGGSSRPGSASRTRSPPTQPTGARSPASRASSSR